MLYIGNNSIENLKNIIHNNDEILLFTGESIFKIFYNKIKNNFSHCNVSIYYEFSKNPKYDEIEEAVKQYKNKKIDKIIAFGGGSVIDFAKAFKYYSQIDIPLVAIPTTAGTGSEMTQFAVVYKNNEKTSIDDKEILPNIAIVDSQFSQIAPQYIKACSAIDAYCQAIESFWAKKATQHSKELAIQAIQLCRDNIVKAVNTQDVKANENMAKASNLSGQAINITRTTAAHALSYKITSKYKLPHGHAVAICMLGLLKQNIEIIPDANILLETMRVTKDNITKYFAELMENIGLEYNLKNLKISNIEEIVESVNMERLSNNPKNMTKDDLYSVFNQ